MTQNRGMFRQYALERVSHGTPCDQAIDREMNEIGASRVFLMASRPASASPGLARLIITLGKRLAGMYCTVTGHVPTPCVIEATQAARDCHADHIIAYGGGSVVDAAKAVSLCLYEKITLEEQLHHKHGVNGLDASQRNSDDFEWIRITAVPLTFSAAEFTWFAGVTDPREGVKNIIGHPMLMPRFVVLDPALTLDVPLNALLASGIKAVDHAAERLASNEKHPFNDAVCIKSLQMLAEALPAIQRDPQNLDARQQCQLAAWLSIAGSGTGVRVGASHALGHVLGAHSNIAHGLTSCALLPAVMRWNQSHNAVRQAQISVAMGRPDVPAGDVIEQLILSLGLPTHLRELGLTRADLLTLSEKSDHDPGLNNNPRPIRSAKDVLELLESAW